MLESLRKIVCGLLAPLAAFATILASPLLAQSATASSVSVLAAGHRPRWAIPANDAGAVPAEIVLHLQVMLVRPAAVQASFEQRLADQQNPSSPLFHQWLTPAQIGELYGPDPAAAEAIRSWLSAQGFRVDATAPSGLFLHVSGTVQTAETAFQTSLHQYRIGTSSNLRVHRSTVSEPLLPVALAPYVGAIQGLSELPIDSPRSQSIAPADGTRPEQTSASGTHFVAPGDFATIYDLNPLYNSGFNGHGSRVAIIGRSQVNPNDISVYETIFGLPSTAVNVVIPPLGADPGQANASDQGEASLDVERVISTAPGAQPDLVISTDATGGLDTAIAYNVQTLLDPIMNISFIGCEANSTQASVNFYASLFAQGAAEGISTFVSAGDAGVAECDDHGSAPPATAGVASINAFCASGFVTCVGGTEFNDTANPTAYWSTSNAPATHASALGYIPEGVWNDPGTAPPFVVLAGGGGTSRYLAQPAFQVGPGVPAGGMRATPDISFTASLHDAYTFCYLNAATPCTYNATTGAYTFSGNGGTSASSPSMAGIAALLDQKFGGPQGNLNPLIYRLANQAYSTAFHDVTVASSGVTSCTTLPSLCNNSVAGASTTTLMTGTAGYQVTTGYDLASGWGSLDVANFVTAALATGASTTTKLTGSSGTLTGTQTLTFSAVVSPTASASTAPTGTVQFFANGVAFGSAVSLDASGQATYSVASSSLTFGPEQITAIYNGDSSFEASTSNQLSLVLNPTGTITDTLTLTASPATQTASQGVVLTAVFASSASTMSPAANITLYTVDGAALHPLDTLKPANNKVTYTVNNLAAGTHTFQASYPGDSTYIPVSSAALAVVVTPLPTTTSLTGATSVNSTAPTTLSATVSGLLTGATSTSLAYVQLFDGSALIGSMKPTLASSTAATTTGTVTFSPTLAAGTHTLTAVYPGDNFTSGSTSPVLSVVSAPPGITLSEASTTITLASPGASGSDALTLTSVGGYSGAANLACAVSYSGTSTITDPPTCSLSSSSLMLTAGGTASATLTIATILPHASASFRVAQVSSTGAPGSRNRSALHVFLAMLFLPALAAVGRRRRILKLAMLLPITLCCCLLSSATGCSSPPQPLVGTTPATYTVTISGGVGTTSTALGTITLVVQ